MKFPKQDLTTVNNADWARLAAYIDGEGHILINGYADAAHKRTFYLRIVITNTDPRLPLWCAKTFGGTVILDTHNAKKKSANKPTYRWMITCKDAHAILLGCFEYFITKQDQAEVALAFQATVRQRGKTRITPVELAFRLQCREDIRILRWKRHSVPEFAEMLDSLYPAH